MRVAVFVVAVLSFVVGCTSDDASEGLPPPSPRASDVVVDPCPDTSGGGSAELPALTLPCLGGGPHVSLAGLTGQPTVVNIWASWCIPCQREVPALQDLHRDADGRVRVIGVDIEDTDASALDFARAVGMRYPSVVDRNGDVLRQLGFPGPPVTLFVAADGAIVHREVGEIARDDLSALVKRHLKVFP